MDQQTQPTVYVIDDDHDSAENLRLVLSSLSIPCKAFTDVDALLARLEPGMVGCVIADVLLPKLTGLELQQELNRRGIEIPFVYVSGHADVRTVRMAFKQGAIDFLEKPISNHDLIKAVQLAFKKDQEAHQYHQREQQRDALLARLTEREREVLGLLLEGCSNAVISEKLAISVRTVEAHRNHVLKKMGVNNCQQLIRKILILDEAAIT